MSIWPADGEVTALGVVAPPDEAEAEDVADGVALDTVISGGGTGLGGPANLLPCGCGCGCTFGGRPPVAAAAGLAMLCVPLLPFGSPVGPSVSCLRGSASNCWMPFRLADQSLVSIGSSPALLLGDDGEYCCSEAAEGLRPGLPPSWPLSIPESAQV
jgi:hypothetical protein